MSKHTRNWCIPEGHEYTVASNVRPDPDGPTGLIWETIARWFK